MFSLALLSHSINLLKMYKFMNYVNPVNVETTFLLLFISTIIEKHIRNNYNSEYTGCPQSPALI